VGTTARVDGVGDDCDVDFLMMMMMALMLLLVKTTST